MCVSLYFSTRPKAYRDVDVLLQAFLTSAPAEGGWMNGQIHTYNMQLLRQATSWSGVQQALTALRIYSWYNSQCPSRLTGRVRRSCDAGKYWNYVLAAATLVARNENKTMVAPVVGSGAVCVWQESVVRRPVLCWCVWQESVVRRSVLCWCVWQESGFGRREDVFTSNLLHEEIFINFALSVRFAKIMLQKKSITVQHKKGNSHQLCPAIPR
jgi:hypothetical protein